MFKPQYERIIKDGIIDWADLNPEQFRNIPCPICGTYDYSVIGSLVINKYEFFIVKCNICGLRWRNAIPDSIFLNDLYNAQYFDVTSYPKDILDQVGIHDIDDFTYDRRKQTEAEIRDWIKIRDIAPKNENGNSRTLLEIGGGRAYLQEYAEKAGWKTMGLEISPHGIKEAIKKRLMVLPILLDDFYTKYLPYKNFFDVVVFFDFLEHVTEPCHVLRVIKAILKNDGYGILRIPLVKDDETPKYHLIDHIWHFSETTFKIIAEREGFQIDMRKTHDSGRFPDENGQVQNRTYFIRKNMRRER